MTAAEHGFSPSPAGRVELSTAGRHRAATISGKFRRETEK